jgi:hypothetical protein
MMGNYWETIIQPLMSAVRPRTIVEIGSHEGISTKGLVDYCVQNNATLHVIDPAPDYSVSTWERDFGSHVKFHLKLSLQAIPTLAQFDVIIVDGDHNWYTVTNELQAIEARSRELSQPFPLTILHDVGWPYGRRDLYYNPETIPAEFRHPYANGGLRPGVPGLIERGFNDHQNNATVENTPRNGVLTAVEDYLKQTKEELKFVNVPGFYGLGLLFPANLLKNNAAFAEFIRMWDLPAPVRQYVQALETARVEFQANANELWMVLQQIQNQSQGGVQVNRAK